MYLVYMVITWYKVARLKKCLWPIKCSVYYRLRTLGQWQGRGENGHLVYWKKLQWRGATRQPRSASTWEGMLGHARSSSLCSFEWHHCRYSTSSDLLHVWSFCVHGQVLYFSKTYKWKIIHSIYFWWLLTYLTRLDSGQCLDISLCQI